MKKFNLEKCKRGNKGITLIALVITIIVLLILAGITINALTGGDSAPAKANEAKQKNDIGAVKDEIALTVQNAQTEAYDDIYVKNNSAVSSTSATTTVGQRVINAVLEHFGGAARGTSNANDTLTATATKGLVSVSITQASGTEDAEITLTTRDFTQTGSISLNNSGVLTWDTMVANSGNLDNNSNETETGNTEEQELTGDPIYGKLAESSEAKPELFTYAIVDSEGIESGKVDGVIENGKVADNTGSIKIAENNVKKAAITGINPEAIQEYVNIIQNEEEEDNNDEENDDENDDEIFNLVSYNVDSEGNSTSYAISFSSWKSVPSFISKIVIPSKVKLKSLEFELDDGEVARIDDEGEEYEIVSVSGLSCLTDNVDYLILPDTVETIDSINGIKNLRLSDNMTSIPQCDLSHNENIIMPFCPSSFANGYNASNTPTLKYVEITGKGDIDNNAFFYCTSLESIKIHEGCTGIGEKAFYRCTSLKKVIIPDSVTSIGEEAFYDCSSLTEVVLPKNLLEIKYNTFEGCQNIIKLDIPDTVKKIGYRAFNGAYRWSNVKLLRDIEEIDSRSIFWCRKTNRWIFN